MTSPAEIQHTRVNSGGVTLHCAHAGKAGGAQPPLLLLHGFPDHWSGWTAQLEALSTNRLVIAPDGRGVNLSSAPAGLDAYHLERLVEDVIAVADVFAPSRPVDLAGHDWGGVIAWAAVSRHPERFRRLAILNASHPRVLGEALARDPVQRAASAYIDHLRAPGAEERLSADGYAALLRAFGELARAGRFSEEDARRHREAWERAGLTGALNWYRAADFLKHPERAPWPAPPLPNPVLLIWGEADQALPASLIGAHQSLAQTLIVELIAGCGHWPAQEQPERVNTLLRRHFSA